MRGLKKALETEVDGLRNCVGYTYNYRYKYNKHLVLLTDTSAQQLGGTSHRPLPFPNSPGPVTPQHEFSAWSLSHTEVRSPLLPYSYWSRIRSAGRSSRQTRSKRNAQKAPRATSPKRRTSRSSQYAFRSFSDSRNAAKHPKTCGGIIHYCDCIKTARYCN